MAIEQKLLKLFAIPLTILLVVALIHIISFILLKNTPPPTKHSDLIVVFPGDSYRLAAAIKIAELEVAPTLAVINKTAKNLGHSVPKNTKLTNLQYLTGGRSRSTFEDAYNTAMIVKNNGLDSILLVTSSYHMPRSLFLLQTHFKLLGLKTDIRHYSVPENETNKGIESFGLYYNEIIKIWGSSLELIGYHITGKLLYDSVWFQKLASLVHTYLLLDI